MKKFMVSVLSLVFVLTMVGCTSNNQELEALKKENAQLKADNEDMQERIDQYIESKKTVDLSVTGDFTIYVRKICPDYECGEDEYRILVAQFFQSAPFLLRVDKSVADQLKEENSYTFRFKNGSVYKGFDNDRYQNNDYTHEQLIAYLFENIVLVGPAKEDELGLNSDRMKVDVLVSDPKK